MHQYVYLLIQWEFTQTISRMSLPASRAPNSCFVKPLSYTFTGTALNTAVDEISTALTRIEVVSSGDTSQMEAFDENDEPSSGRLTATFCDLPSEILLVIFAYASQTGERWEALSFSLVCRHWRALMLSDPSLWSHIALVVHDCDPQPTPPTFTSSHLRMVKLTRMYLERSENCFLSVTIQTPTRFRGLNANIPWQSYISVAAIDSLQRECHRIQHLHLRVDHGLLHDFAYRNPCRGKVDSGHSRPCSETIPLDFLVSLSVDYISRNFFYFPFRSLPQLKHLTLSNEGFSFFQESTSQSVPELRFPKLVSFRISESPSFHHLCRTMTVTNASPRIQQVVLLRMPSLADFIVSSNAISQAIFPEISALKIVDSSDHFTATFCRVFQFSALRSFELVYSPPTTMSTGSNGIMNKPISSKSRIGWQELACDIVYFIGRCPMIQSVTLRSAREQRYPETKVVQGITFQPGISPDIYIVGFPLDSSEDVEEGALTANAMMRFLAVFELG